MGAKNHGVIMPDANKEYVVNQVALPLSPHHASYSRCSFYPFQLVGAAFGAAGQRCMALTTAVMVWTYPLFLFLILSIKFDRAFVNNSQSNLMSNIIIILNLCFYYAS